MSTTALPDSQVAAIDRGVQAPVALFVFNRPETTRQVFTAIAAARPAILLIVADGARDDRPGEADRVAAVRAEVAAVDWPCDVRYDYATTNLGSRRRVSSGLDWVFGQVDRAIVLEDDCVPTSAFFRFCDEMLARYRDDRRIYSISGSNFAEQDAVPAHYFSNFALMWGWATWADRWADYRVNPTDSAAVIRRQWGRSPMRVAYWSKVFAALTAERMDAWDYQWILTLWRQRAYCVRPTINLVRNIGFGAGATHTTVADTPLATIRSVETAASFGERVGPTAADRFRDRIDERVWARLTLPSVVQIHFPWLRRPRWLRR